MKEIERFVKQLFKHQKLSSDDTEAIKKLIEMLEEKVEDLIEAGMDESDAVHKSIVEFGELDDFYEPLVRKEKRRYKMQKTIRHYKNDLFFSAVSSALIIVVLVFVNIQYLTFARFGPWFIIPAAGLLFWPLSLLYKLLNKRGE